jgi:NAD(P)-dependent dehydrogenase (short-subunit alcohol dehydrogenase family)
LSTGERVAIVTGASRGIGKQTALLLAQRGIRVVLAARTSAPRPSTPGTLAETAEELRALGAEPVTIQADVGLQSDLEQIVSTALQRFGRVDILINNAAYTVGKTLFTHVPDLTRDQWERHFSVNVTAPLMLIQGVWDSMRRQGGGVVVNVTSGAAQLQEVTADRSSSTGLPDNGPAYGASKAALNRMANVIAQEGLPHRIAVIAVEPGFVLTETMAATFARSGVTETNAISTHVPAAAITHLCTCENPLLYTGQIVSAPALVEELGLA